MLAFQMFENMGMTMGIMPVTGIPLPFMSYGGSSLITTFACLGLVANVSMQAILVALVGSPRMSNLWPRVEPLLARVEKPARYIGMERGSLRPEHRPSSTSWLLVYPDTYEIGLPNQGLQILYEILNERDDAVAERAYAPWVDMNAEMRAASVPFFSVDTHHDAGDFDVLAFGLAAELVYTNVLECLDLAGVPVRAEQRRPEHPLVIVGGHCAFNPEPMADFVDAFVIGDGEEAVGEITEVVGAWKRSGRTGREGVLRELATIPGVYVPSMYDVDYDGPFIAEVRPRFPDVPERVDKRTVADLGEWPLPEGPARAAHRGGARPSQRRGVPRLHARLPVLPGGDDHPAGARAAGRPGAHDGAGRPAAHRVRRGRAHLALDRRLLRDRRPGRRSWSTSSRAAATSACRCRRCGSTRSRSGIASEIQKIRRTGLTFAPEGGTWRVRQVINKLITDDDLYAAVEGAYSQGWQRVKLYFLIGVPTEMDEDTLGIAELAREVVKIGRKYTKKASCHRVGRRLRAEGAHAVPVVRAEQRPGAPAQGRDAPRRPEALRRRPSAGTIPPRPSPRASPAGATAGSGA